MTPLPSFDECQKKYEPEIQNFISGIIRNDSQAFIVLSDAFLCLKNRYHEFTTEEDAKASLYIEARVKSINFLKYQKLLKNPSPMFKIVSIGRWGDIGGILLYFAGLIDFVFYSHTLNGLIYSYGLYLAVKLLVSYITYYDQKRAFRDTYGKIR